jgi:hypothetical protein
MRLHKNLQARAHHIRRVTGLSNRQISKAIGRSPSYITDMLARTKDRDVLLKKAMELAALLGLPAEKLIFAEEIDNKKHGVPTCILLCAKHLGH